MARHNLPCPDCGGKHSLSDYGDHTYCHKLGCFTYTEVREELNKQEEPLFIEEAAENVSHRAEGHEPKAQSVPRITPLAKNFTALTDRGISQEAAVKYKVKAVLNNEIKNVSHVYPYFDKDGNHIGNKCRTKFNKGFFVEGDISKAGLFGQQAFAPGGKSLTIVEGECDAMAAYQMFGHKYPVVSVKSAATAVKNVLDNYDYVTSFNEIVLVFDSDKGQVKADGSVVQPGQDAARAVAAVLPLGKCRVVTLTQAKDANEYLQAGKEKEFTQEWWNAPSWTPAGIRLGKDLWEDIRAPKNLESINYPWPSLNEITYGIRPSELVIITGKTGEGKTSVLKEIEHYLLANSNYNLGILHLEETNADTGLGLMSIEANKPLHLPDVRETVKDDELKAYYDKTINSERVIIYDHFGSNDIHDLLAKIKHMVALGAKYIVLDHLSIVVSDQRGDERKQLDEITTKLKTLCMELNIAVLAVIHQNRQGEIRGTAGVEQLANIVIKLDRNKEDEDPWRRNITKIIVQKNRFCGRTGPACWLQYIPETGRLEELGEQDIKKFEAGESSTQLGEW